jgi:hypothetical protein
MKVDRQIFIKQKLFQFRSHVMKKILLDERGQFRRRQDGFNFHFASREGRDGGEENLESINILGG